MRGLRVTGLVGLMVVAVAVGCGGGSDGRAAIPGGPTGGGSGLFNGTFVATQPSPGASQITATLDAANGSTVTVAVEVTDVSNLFGASFDVTFDPTFVNFMAEAPGGALENGGTSVAYQVDVQPGRLVVGASRLGGSSTNVVGTGTLILLTFDVIQAGDSPFGFENETLQDGSNPPQPIGGLTWFGGSFQAS